MISKETIEELIAEKLLGGEYFVVSLDISTSNKIKLVVDSIQGITIEECVAFSRLIEHNLDREVEDFELEVTSPGLTTPLTVRQQYVKNVNQDLDILLEDGARIKGTLTRVNENGIIILEEKRVKVEGKKKKQLIKQEHTIDFSIIKSACIVIKF